MIAALMLAFCLGVPEAPAPLADEDPFKLTEEMKQFVAANVVRSGDAFQNLQALVRVVFQDNLLHFTYVPETRTAAETFDQHGGNCLSFTFLFISMARHLGLDARFQEVEIVPIWSKVGNIVSVSGHANAAILIGSKRYAADLFPQVNRVELGGRVVSDARAVAHFYNNKGVSNLSKGRLEAARQYFKRAISSDPTLADAWTNLGVVHTEAGEYEEAEESYRKTLQLDSKNLVAMGNLASLYEHTGRNREAQTYIAKVRKFRDKNPYYHFSLGLQAYESGAYLESVEHYRTALKLKSAEHNFYFAIAKAYAKLGDQEKAAESIKSALKNAPDDSSKVRYSEKLALLASHRPHP